MAKSKKERRQPVTQRMIAEELGYSQETVSHILSNGPRKSRYSAETQQRVIAYAEKLGYRPHRGAQVMRNGKSNLIGVLCFGWQYEIVLRTSAFLPRALRDCGYRVLVLDLGWDVDMEGGAVDHLIDARVEGIIVTSMNERFGRAEVEKIQREGIPVITLSGSEHLGIPVIHSEVKGAVEKLVQHLVALGRRRILLLTNQYDARPREERIAGFTTGMEASGGEVLFMASDVETVKRWTERPDKAVSGAVVSLVETDQEYLIDKSMLAYSYARELFASGVRPDAIMCSNDIWARGVFSAAIEAGVSVPEELAITGIDGDSFGAFPPYYLTTIVNDGEQECKAAARIICEMIKGKTPPEKTVFPSQLLIRRSCGAAAGIGKEHLL